MTEEEECAGLAAGPPGGGLTTDVDGGVSDFSGRRMASASCSSSEKNPANDPAKMEVDARRARP
jgi:hypothetical protein